MTEEEIKTELINRREALMDEHNELFDRIQVLKSQIFKHQMIEASDEEVSLAQVQLDVMTSYINILELRIKDIDKRTLTYITNK